MTATRDEISAWVNPSHEGGRMGRPRKAEMTKTYTLDSLRNVTVSPVTEDDGRFEWTASVTDTTDEFDSYTVAYHTNRDGEGLWVNGQQVEGTCQFSLAGVSASTRRRRVLAASGVQSDEQ